MKKYLVRIAAVWVAFAALAITARAQALDQAIIKIPYQFVVVGTTLPAGTYRLGRSNSFNDRGLTKIETAGHVFVLPKSKAAILEAKKSHQGSAPSGVSGTD